ncbi:hypothetical protein [Paenibacillus herberti]|uniref:Uncharacterized protein n=1 Tax=Paenibacillus herberti TaxID=1619309 RepID=A0A229P0R0_9BACL|nr:hypothetical protein [Paenibacillus herberti]OXM15718.1 hypothetical protein CGZ75_03045 [Paenibacillus herberti]
MKLNKLKTFNWKITAAVGAVLIAASWTGNLLYWSSMQLGKPYFFQHYFTVNEGSEGSLSFRYLEDNNAGVTVISVGLDEYPQFRFHLSESMPSNYQKQMIALAEWRPNEVTSNRYPSGQQFLTVNYSDGSWEKIPTGYINVVKNDEQPIKIKSTSRGGGTATEDLILEKIELLPDGEELKRFVEVQLTGFGGKDIKPPFELAKGEPLSLSYNFEFAGNAAMAASYYESSIQLSFSNKEGQKLVQRIEFIHTFESLPESEIYALAKAERKSP